MSAAMERLCGRPGCSERASVAYGMRAEDLVFWLDVLPAVVRDDTGVLCLRHADSMVVPRGWTLDDLRDPDLHLFRPPAASTRVRSGRLPRPVRAAVVAEQLQLAEPIAPGDVFDSTSAPDGGHQNTSGDELDGTAQHEPWTPSFDEADDLDGLLSAESPLLSRAFRTAERADG